MNRQKSPNSSSKIISYVTASVILGCGSSKTSDSGQDAGTFLAFATNFEGYRNWSHAAATADGAPSGVHSSGPMTVYWNETPPRGSTEFPIGTLIVKETDPGVTPAQIFAMVKRGGGYNSSGARNWEWFELQAADDETVLIVWRGAGPPNGETYGGDPTTCNNCHVQAATNDFVWSSALQLSSF
jgi:hypothetical protein